MNAAHTDNPPGNRGMHQEGRFRQLKGVLSWAVALGLLGYVVHTCASDREAMHSLSRFPPGWFLALVSLGALHNLVSSLRIFVVARHLGLRNMPFLNWFRIFVTSRTMNMLMGQLGNAYRAVSLKRIYGFPYSKMAGTYLIFSLLDALLNCLLMAVAVAIWNPPLRLGVLPVLPVAAAMTGGLALLMPLVAVTGRAIARRTGGASGFGARLTRSAADILASFTDLKLVAVVSGIGFLTFLLNMGMVYVAFAGIGKSLDMPSLVIFVGILRFSYIIVITPGNLGIREMAYGFLSTAMGIEMSQGMVASALLRFSTYTVLGTLTGAFLLAGKEAAPAAADGDDAPVPPANPT